MTEGQRPLDGAVVGRILKVLAQGVAWAFACVPRDPRGGSAQLRDGDDRIAELQLENSRLRRLVTDLLLEKIRLEEAAQSQKFDRVSLSKIPSIGHRRRH